MLLKEKIIDISTGEETIIERDETSAETKARLELEEKRAAVQAEAAAKSHERSTLLAKLGITEDEAKLLLE